MIYYAMPTFRYTYTLRFCLEPSQMITRTERMLQNQIWDLHQYPNAIAIIQPANSQPESHPTQ